MRNTFLRSLALAGALGPFLGGCEDMNLDRMKPPAASQPPSSQATAGVVTFPVPQWKAGDEWLYSDGYGLRVTRVEPNGATRFERTDEPSQWFTRRGLFREESQGEDARRVVVYRTGDPMALFAAGVNRTISYVREYMRDSTLVRHRVSWVIEGKERITVPAGTFDCWLVVMRTEGLDSNWRAYERWYYSPEARAYVRLEFKYGESPDASRVLVSYKLASQKN